MTSKSDGPGKDASRPANPQAQNRPHATIDLKATEIKGAAGESKKDEAKPVPPADTAIKAGESKTAPPPQPGPAKPQDKPAIAPPPATSSGGTLSHFLAGIVGGIIAMGASSWLDLSSKPIATAALDERARMLEARMTAIEEAKGAPEGSSTANYDELAARVGKVEALEPSVRSLTDAHAKLVAETKALSDKLAQAPQADNTTADRVSRLEDRLATLASAAGPNGEGGSNISQLAMITGKISDLESKIDNQIAAMRKAIPDEVSTRLGTVSEASEAARSGTQRADRELQALKTDVVRLGQRAETLKADNERITQTLDVLKEDLGRQTSALSGLKSSVEQQLKSVARPADVTSAVSAIADKVSGLEGNLASVVKSEQDRKADAERILISLELANLKRAIDGGHGYASELAAVRKAAGSRFDLSSLDRYQTTGLPSLADLEREFHTLAYAIIEADSAPTEGGVVDKLLAGAKSVVRVRKVDLSPDDKSAEAVVARMEMALKDGRLGDALAQSKDIPPKAIGRASEWLSKAEARQAVDRAIAALEGQLKTSLSGAAAGNATPPPAATGSN